MNFDGSPTFREYASALGLVLFAIVCIVLMAAALLLIYALVIVFALSPYLAIFWAIKDCAGGG